MLHFEVSGHSDPSRRLVLVHGFTQTGRSWDGLLAALGRDRQVMTVDAPAHGRSTDTLVGLEEGARLLGQAGGEADYIGYSMGGRLALHLAVQAPHLVRRLVLVGATAGIEDAGVRADRRRADDALATGLEAEGLDAFLARWLTNPLFATLPADAADLAARRANTVTGLAASLRLMGTGSQEPQWQRLAGLRVPVLFVVGERDEKFTALAHRMAAAWGGPSRVAVVADSGHAVHLERPDAFLDAVSTFLEAPLVGAHDSASPTANNPP